MEGRQKGVVLVVSFCMCYTVGMVLCVGFFVGSLIVGEMGYLGIHPAIWGQGGTCGIVVVEMHALGCFCSVEALILGWEMQAVVRNLGIGVNRDYFHCCLNISVIVNDMRALRTAFL